VCTLKQEKTMLDDTLKAQLQQYLGLLRQPIRLIASLDDSETGTDMKSLLETIVSLSDKVTLDTSGNDARKPSFEVVREGETQGVRFAGLPLGHEFTSLVLALLWTGGHPPKVEAEVIDSIKALDGDFSFEVYMSLTCHNCPDVVQALSLMAIFNPKVKTVAPDHGGAHGVLERPGVRLGPHERGRNRGQARHGRSEARSGQVGRQRPL
jgi:NADH-dependent peroxiredoxin subunit F